MKEIKRSLRIHKDYTVLKRNNNQEPHHVCLRIHKDYTVLKQICFISIKSISLRIHKDYTVLKPDRVNSLTHDSLRIHKDYTVLKQTLIVTKNWINEYAAAITTVLTILAFLPQIFKVFKNHSGKTLNQTSFLISYLGSVVLSIYSSIHNPFVWTTLIVDLTIVFLMMPILYFIFSSRYTFKKTIILMSGISLINILLFVVFVLTRIKIIPTGLSDVGEMLMATFGFALTGLAFFPQTLTIVKNKKVGDYSLLLSFTYAIAQSLNVVFWTGRYVVEHLNYLDFMPGLILAGISALIQYSALTIVGYYRWKLKVATSATY